MNILLAEQSRAVAFALRRLLEGKGHRVEIAFDGVQALDHLQNGSFDFLIVEMDLPRIDGPSLHRFAAIRGVVVPSIGVLPSSEVTKEDLIENAGMEALLPKPYPADALLALLDMISEDKFKENSGLSFWQRKLLEALSEGDAVTYEKLTTVLPKLYGSVRAFLSATDDILARNGSKKRIVAEDGGYKVRAI